MSHTPYSQIKTRFFTLFEQIVEQRGFKPLYGQLIVRFLLSPRPLTQSNIQAATGYSRSAISRALDFLVKNGTVRRSRQPGSHTIQYQMTVSLPHLVSGVIQQWLQGLKQTRRTVQELITDYPSEVRPEESEEEHKLLYKRLQELESFSSNAIRLFNKLTDELLQ